MTPFAPGGILCGETKPLGLRYHRRFPLCVVVIKVSLAAATVAAGSLSCWSSCGAAAAITTTITIAAVSATAAASVPIPAAAASVPIPAAASGLHPPAAKLSFIRQRIPRICRIRGIFPRAQGGQSGTKGTPFFWDYSRILWKAANTLDTRLYG